MKCHVICAHLVKVPFSTVQYLNLKIRFLFFILTFVHHRDGGYFFIDTFVLSIFVERNSEN